MGLEEEKVVWRSRGGRTKPDVPVFWFLYVEGLYRIPDTEPLDIMVVLQFPAVATGGSRVFT